MTGKLTEDFIQAQKDLIALVEKLRSQRYLQMINNPKKFILMHFLAGVASGVGGAIGASVVFALIVFLLSQLQLVPIIGHFVTEVIKVVEENLR